MSEIKQPAVMSVMSYKDLARDMRRAAGIAEAIVRVDEPSEEVTDAMRLMRDAAGLLDLRAKRMLDRLTAAAKSATQEVRR